MEEGEAWERDTHTGIRGHHARMGGGWLGPTPRSSGLRALTRGRALATTGHSIFTLLPEQSLHSSAGSWRRRPRGHSWCPSKAGFRGRGWSSGTGWREGQQAEEMGVPPGAGWEWGKTDPTTVQPPEGGSHKRSPRMPSHTPRHSLVVGGVGLGERRQAGAPPGAVQRGTLQQQVSVKWVGVGAPRAGCSGVGCSRGGAGPRGSMQAREEARLHEQQGSRMLPKALGGTARHGPRPPTLQGSIPRRQRPHRLPSPARLVGCRGHCPQVGAHAEGTPRPWPAAPLPALGGGRGAGPRPDARQGGPGPKVSIWAFRAVAVGVALAAALCPVERLRGSEMARSGAAFLSHAQGTPADHPWGSPVTCGSLSPYRVLMQSPL